MLGLQGKLCTYKKKEAGGTWSEYQIKVAPSNYSRKNEIMADMTIQGREFVIPLSSIRESGMEGIPKKGDVIIYENKHESIVEVMPMADLGGTSMGFRIRVG